MFHESILFLLFLGTIAQHSVSNHLDRNDSLILPDYIRKNPNSFLLVNPKQVKIMELSIQRFLSKMAEPVKRPIVLRSKKNNLQLTIREMCDSIRKKLMQFAKDCNLTNTFQQYKQTSSELPISEDWFSEALLQIAFLLRDVGNMINEVDDEINQYFGERNVTSRTKQRSRSQSDELQFMGVVYNAADFGERLSQCLLRVSSMKRRKTSYDLNRAVLNITRNPPRVALRTFKSTLRSTSYDDVPKNPAYKSWQAFLCLAMTGEQGTDYNDCIRDLLNLNKCLRSTKQLSENRMRKVPDRTWMKAIKQLSDCKVYPGKNRDDRVTCRSTRKTPKTVSDTFAKKPWGQRFANELCQFCTIYDNGLRKYRKLSVLRTKDKKTTRMQEKVSKAIQVYRTGMYERIFGAISGLHRSMTDFEKLLVSGIKNVMNESWQSHVRILSCVMDWMNRVLEFSSDEGSRDGQQMTDTSTAVEESNENDGWSSEFFRSDEEEENPSRSRVVLKKAEASVNNLIESMNHLSRQQSSNDNSMLACLANNVLLVTMFMQTLGFASTLFCFENGMKNETRPLDVDNEPLRTRRSKLCDVKQ
ncbi:PREDICTED: uncharacterized protein LOC107186225 [Dufourea novaeangliae]|uniref:uncharacterized protein LOC107186225 n=1 Tax=Dufourea novaeangliae TaxID=178035 RepID=UPI00076730DB|nr:PREDICTED: uncharacterized protein LOC107186225 [Dufourea novaeangliae]